MADLLTGVIGMTGALVGAGVNELLRRFNRIETYSAKVFEKRLEAYEGLMVLMQAGYAVATDVMDATELDAERRLALISETIHEIAVYTDQHELYLDHELTGHCTATFMGAEDVCDLPTEAERGAARQAVVDMYVEAKRMIREDSGVEGVNRIFKRAARPKLNGEFIERLRELRRQHAKTTRPRKQGPRQK